MPSGLLAEHGDVTITIDIMYINKNPFMMTTSQAIHFGIAELIKNKAKSTILKSPTMDVVSRLEMSLVIDNLNELEKHGISGN